MAQKMIAVHPTFFKENGLALYEIARRYLCAITARQLFVLRCICRGVKHEEILAMAHAHQLWSLLQRSYEKFLPDVPGCIRGQRFVTYLIGYYEGYRFITEGGDIEKAGLYCTPMSDEQFLSALRTEDGHELLLGDEVFADGFCGEGEAVEDGASDEASPWKGDDST